MTATEANYDGLIGPTHNYAGLSPGNLASAKNKAKPASPRAAVLQGLAKMKRLAGLGLVQGIIPPQERPATRFLRAAGFSGSDAAMIEAAGRTAPDLLAVACSASPMWAANAATVSPSPDTADGRVHFTPANLVAMPHRAMEAGFTARVLKVLFPDESRFAHHDPLFAHPFMGDEGAANHGRLAEDHGSPGLELFVYGRDGEEDPKGGGRHPRRQSRQASEAVARLHGLDPERTLFLKQSRAAIDGGAFHNDVVGVANARTLFLHEDALEDQAGALAAVRRAAEAMGLAVEIVEVPRAEVSLKDAVESYLFNSQLVTLPDGRQILIVPSECEENDRVRRHLERLEGGNGPIRETLVVDVRQSMRNGGGPACLRLRVAMSEAERAAAHQGALLTDALHDKLTGWAARRYRESLSPADLADPALLVEAREALDDLTGILGLPGDLYDFQRG